MLYPGRRQLIPSSIGAVASRHVKVRRRLVSHPSELCGIQPSHCSTFHEGNLLDAHITFGDPVPRSGRGSRRQSVMGTVACFWTDEQAMHVASGGGGRVMAQASQRTSVALHELLAKRGRKVASGRRTYDGLVR